MPVARYAVWRDGHWVPAINTECTAQCKWPVWLDPKRLPTPQYQVGERITTKGYGHNERVTSVVECISCFLWRGDFTVVYGVNEGSLVGVREQSIL
jgi:hypothetical protein